MENEVCKSCKERLNMWEQFLNRTSSGPFYIFGHCKLHNTLARIEPIGNVLTKGCECEIKFKYEPQIKT